MATDDSGALSVGRLIGVSERIIRGIEVVAAYLLVGLFAVGVIDIFLQIIALALPGGPGSITQPQSIIGLLDRVLLLFIIVELYQTVVAYTQEQEELEIVTTALYAGVIAMVRKAILFQTSDYSDVTAALIAAGSYMLILVGLAAVLFVAYRYGSRDPASPSE